MRNYTAKLIKRHKIHIPKVSFVQKQLYETIKLKYSDAKLEYRLEDIGIYVDIYIPALNTVYEMYGDIWHCNPKIYTESFIQPKSKKTAKEIWKYDKEREMRIRNAGYKFFIVWENDFNKTANFSY